MTVTVLLSTYNGERFLPEQIESILAQDYFDWRLIARDDGSSDATPSILASYRNRYPDLIRLAPDSGTPLGVVDSFCALARLAEGPFACFCDQDDLWMPQKLGTMVGMAENERMDKVPYPVVLFADMALIDSRGRTLPGTFIKSESISLQHKDDPNYIVYRNIAPGCSTMVNNAALRFLRQRPRSVIMHDWWMVLGAALRGKNLFLDEPLMHYRIHEGNAIGLSPGTARWGVRGSIRRIETMRRVIAQGRDAYACSGRRFSTARFLWGYIRGNWISPALGLFSERAGSNSWRA